MQCDSCSLLLSIDNCIACDSTSCLKCKEGMFLDSLS